MRLKLLIVALTGSVAAASLVSVATAAETSNRTRAQAEQRYSKYRKYRASKENSHTVRANSLDPARTYGGYPDWARVALSPKSDGGGRRR